MRPNHTNIGKRQNSINGNKKSKEPLLSNTMQNYKKSQEKILNLLHFNVTLILLLQNCNAFDSF